MFRLQNLNLINIIKHATLEVLTALIMKNALFWVIMSCSSEPDVLEEQMTPSSWLKEKAKQIPAEDGSACCLLLLGTYSSQSYGELKKNHLLKKRFSNFIVNMNWQILS